MPQETSPWFIFYCVILTIAFGYVVIHEWMYRQRKKEWEALYGPKKRTRP